MARTPGLNVLVATLCLTPSSVAIAAPAREPVHRFAIPAGKLADALTMFSVTTSLQIVADGATLRGRRSPRLSGRYPATEALRRLLAGQDIGFTIKGNSVILRARAPRPSRPTPPRRAIRRAVTLPAPPPPAEPPQDVLVIGRGEARQIQSVPAAEIARTVPGTSPLRLVEKLPGVSFQSANALGTNEYSLSLSIRSFNQNQLGFTLDGVSLGDHSYDNFNGLHASRAVLSDNLARVTLTRGSGDLETASTSNIGGTLAFETREPSAAADVATAASLGDKGAVRLFARLETGEIAHGLTAYVSGARLDAPNWKGLGREQSAQANAKLRWQLDDDTLVRAYTAWSDLAADDYIDMSAATLARYGYDWDYLRGDFATAAEIARLYQANPAGDCSTNPYPNGIRCADDSYYDGYGLRRDLLGYLRIDRALGGGWSVRLQPYAHRNRGEGTWWYPYRASPDGTPLSVRSSGYRIARYGLMASIEGQIGEHQLTAGGWWEENRHAKWRYLYALAANGTNFARRSWPDPDDRFHTYYDHQMQARTTSAFVRDRWQISGSFRIEAGVRALRVALSNHTIAGAPAVNGRIVSADAFLPQLGMTWQSGGGAEIFANYNENMRAFGQGVFGTDQAGFDRVRATIRPETARTIEGGVRWRSGGLETVLAAYRIDFDHRLAFTSPCSAIETCASVPANVGSVRTFGFEAAATWRVAPALSLYGAWSLTDTRYRHDIKDGGGTLVVATAGKVAVNTPRHIASAEATYDDGGRFLRVTVNHQSDRYYSYLNDRRVPGRTLVDLTGGLRFANGLELQANISNLFDIRYIATIGESGFPDSDVAGTFRSMMVGPPRQFFLTIKHGLPAGAQPRSE